MLFEVLRQKLIYFKKSNPEFYNGLLLEIQDFENHLVSKSGTADSSAFAQFYNKADDYIEKIHEYINDMYLGKKIKNK